MAVLNSAARSPLSLRRPDGPAEPLHRREPRSDHLVGGAPPPPGGLCVPIYRGRGRLNVLWARSGRAVARGSNLRRSHPAWREAGRSADSGANKIRAGDQYEGCQGDRIDHPARISTARRRGDRIATILLRCICPLLAQSRPTGGLYYFVRFQGEADMHDRLPLTSLSAIDPEQTSNDVRSPRCLRRLYNDTARETRSNPGGIANRRTGNGKCHRKIAPGFRTGKNEPAAAHSELEPRGSRGGRDSAGSQGRGQAARGPLRQPHLL